MKKNILFSLLAVFALLAASSCSSDDLAMEGSNGSVSTATFTITAPGTFLTRAIGDGTTATTVACALYDVSDNPDGVLAGSIDDAISNGNNTYTWNTRVVQGRSYKAVFFAYNKAGGAYDVSNLKNIQLKAENVKANAENMDAFSGSVDVDATNQQASYNVTLNRVVAQVNFGSSDFDDAVSRGVTVTKSQITFSNVYSAFDAFTGKVKGAPSSLTYRTETIPSVDLSANNANYKYIGLAYVLVPDEQLLIDKITYKWETSDGRTNNPVTTFLNVPIRRNFRTNIVGSLLTNPSNFTIDLDNNFDANDENFVIVSPSDLKNYTFEASKDYLIKGEINADGSSATTIKTNDLPTIKGKNITLANLNVEFSNAKQCTITSDKVNLSNIKMTGSRSGRTVCFQIDSRDVVIENVDFEVNNGYNAINICNSTSEKEKLVKNVRISNVTFDGTRALRNNAISIYGTDDNATVTIENCKLLNVSNPLRWSNRANATGVTVNIKNCEWSSNTVAWNYFTCFQDFTSTSAEDTNTRNLFGPDKATFNITNVKNADGNYMTAEKFGLICRDYGNPEIINYNNVNLNWYPTYVISNE